MELFDRSESVPAWISFENKTGAKGSGGCKNNGAKSQADTICPRGILTLCDVNGSGVIRRIWITIDRKTPEFLRGIRLKMYWDGCVTPAVDVPLGDFFCMNAGAMYSFENEFFSSPEARSFCCFIPMPFHTNAKIVAENMTDDTVGCFFYDIDLTYEKTDDSALYFHACHTITQKNALGEDFVLMPLTRGCGRFLGTSVCVEADASQYGSLWWGEGEVKIYLDGDKEKPSLCGTGSEDYIGTAWGQGCFSHRTQGCLECGNGRAVWYRFHSVDPIFFKNDCRVTIQALGGAFRRDVEELAAHGAQVKPVSLVTDSDFFPLAETGNELESVSVDGGWVNFYRSDSCRATSYFYISEK